MQTYTFYLQWHHLSIQGANMHLLVIQVVLCSDRLFQNLRESSLKGLSQHFSSIIQMEVMACPRFAQLRANSVSNSVLPSQPWCSTRTEPSLCILTSPGPEIFLGAAADDAPAAAEELRLLRCPLASVRQHW